VLLAPQKTPSRAHKYLRKSWFLSPRKLVFSKRLRTSSTLRPFSEFLTDILLCSWCTLFHKQSLNFVTVSSFRLWATSADSLTLPDASQHLLRSVSAPYFCIGLGCAISARRARDRSRRSRFPCGGHRRIRHQGRDVGQSQVKGWSPEEQLHRPCRWGKARA
jgi:hypothetical protein